jgi:hypothetical protein
MRKSAYQQLIDSLAGIPVPDEAKRQFEELIRRRAAQDGVTGLELSERVQFARHLLDLRQPRAVISRRLMARYSIGRTQAYKAVNEALQLSGFPPGNRTQTGSNEALDERTLNESRLL